MQFATKNASTSDIGALLGDLVLARSCHAEAEGSVFATPKPKTQKAIFFSDLAARAWFRVANLSLGLICEAAHVRVNLT